MVTRVRETYGHIEMGRKKIGRCADTKMLTDAHTNRQVKIKTHEERWTGIQIPKWADRHQERHK